MTTPAQLVTPPDTAMMRAGIAEVLRSEPGNHMALDLKWALNRIAKLEAALERHACNRSGCLTGICKADPDNGYPKDTLCHAREALKP
jgi:hypothetical protein